MTVFYTILFLLISCSLIWIQKRREGNWINMVSILIGPYIPIVFFNNFYVYKLGFYKIQDEVLIMLLWAFISFFIGSLFLKSDSKRNSVEGELLLRNYDINKLNLFLLLVGVLGMFKLLLMIRSGVFVSDASDAEGMITGGLVGHFLLASYSVLPIYFLYWTTQKSFKNLIPIILILIVTFSSLIKYNIIGVFVSIYIFLSMYKKRVLKKATIILVGSVVIVFSVNYIISFLVVDQEATAEFIVGHLWKYTSGSVIRDNYIFTSGNNVGVSIWYKIATFFSSIPNMFLSVISDIRLFPYKGQDLLPVSDFGEESNVVDAVGYLFPSKGSLFDIIEFGIVFFLLGFVFSYIYKKHMHVSCYYDTFISNFLCYFIFFSFFGTFYINSGPWEIIIYSLFVPKFFLKHEKNTIQHLRA